MSNKGIFHKEFFPRNVEVTKDVIVNAGRVMEGIGRQGSNPGQQQMMIGSYFGHNHVVEYTKEGDDKGRPYLRKTGPTAAVVAFREPSGVVVIGWAKRHPKMEREFEHKPGDFPAASRKNILGTAIIRGLTDSVEIVSEDEAYSSNGRPLPRIVAREVYKMRERALKYFKETAANVSEKTAEQTQREMEKHVATAYGKMVTEAQT